MKDYYRHMSKKVASINPLETVIKHKLMDRKKTKQIRQTQNSLKSLEVSLTIRRKSKEIRRHVGPHRIRICQKTQKRRIKSYGG